jgi:hypothetical protein
VFAARELVLDALHPIESVKAVGASLSADYLTRQITRMGSALANDPELALGTAKELIETCCKTIAADRGTPADEGWNIPKLVHHTLQCMSLVPAQGWQDDSVDKTVRKTLGNLAQIAQRVAELRNLCGTGHGKLATASAPSQRYVKLAVNAACTLAVFLFETHTEAGSSA